MDTNETPKDDTKIVRPTFGVVEGGGKPVEVVPETEYVFDGELDPADYDALKLKELTYGDTVVGTLTDDEAGYYAAMFHAYAELEACNRDLGGSMVEKLGKGIRDGSVKIGGGEPHELRVSKDEADDIRHMFKVQQHYEMLKGNLWWLIKSRLNLFDHEMAIRSKRRIVKREKKFQE